LSGNPVGIAEQPPVKARHNLPAPSSRFKSLIFRPSPPQTAQISELP